MKKQLHTLAAVALLFNTSFVSAQALTEKTGLRFYEHHSSDMTGSSFGNGADGSQSGYDFVNQEYYSSFNESTFGRYTNGEESNLDMVEHNGPFGSPTSPYLGFTSGVSTIWAGDIQGNGTTRWMKAPASFNYTTAADVTTISQAFNNTTAIVSVPEVRQGDVFLGRIRGGSQYVAIMCTGTRIPSSSQGMQNVYFDFSYKTGSLATGLPELTVQQFDIYPNPAAEKLHFRMAQTTEMKSLQVFDITGKEVLSATGSYEEIDIRALHNGLYILKITTLKGETATRKFVKN